jgi:hypothetical protein
MSIRLERGPFRRFEGEWRLVPLGPAGCRIEFEMRYDFNNAIARLAGPVFDRITTAMVDAYVARADALYGTHAATVERANESASEAPADATRPETALPPATAAPAAVPPAAPDAGTEPGAMNPDPPRSDPP